MPQIKSSYDEVRIPFSKMTYSPDVPSTALGPNEYNYGLNVETDVRGIRSIAGDVEILSTIPGTPTYVSAGFRQGGQFWFIVATTEGYWYASDGVTNWYNITPGGGPILGYNQATNITEAWNGTIPFFNDTLNPPMFLPDEPNAVLIRYQNSLPQDIKTIEYLTPTTQRLTILNQFTATGNSITGYTLTIGILTEGQITVGEYITGTGITSGTKIVKNLSGTSDGSTWLVNFSQSFSGDIVGSVWDTNQYLAGSQIVISGVNNFYNGTFTVVDSTTTTIDYFAVPGSGGFPSSPTGNVSALYTWNYNPNWKSYYANFMRMYSTPNVGSILVAGNLTVTNNDVLETTTLYPVTIQWSQAFGLNQAPQTWTPTITNVANQLEVPLRGPALDAFPCNGQFFLCSYWDTVVFSPLNYSTTSAPILGVRLYNQGRGLLSSNCWANTDKMVYGIDARDVWVFDGTDFSGLGNQRVKNWLFDQLDPIYYDRVFMEVNSQKNQVEIYYPDNQATNGVPNKMLSYRYDLDVWNSPRDVDNATMSCESPIYTNNVPNLGSRTVVYARGIFDHSLVQMNQGYTDANGLPITSRFRRNNIKLLKDYSGKLMVHRILPEVNNLGAEAFTGDYNTTIDPATSINKGNITVTIEGATSVGSSPTIKTPVTIPIDTTNPWCQIDQNAYRVNNIELSNTSDNSVWICEATTWQITQVEDDR